MCSVCGEDLTRLNRTTTRCEHELHRSCLHYDHPKVRCGRCENIITHEIYLRYDIEDKPFHSSCNIHAKRTPIKRCPICAKGTSMTHMELESMMKDLEPYRKVEGAEDEFYKKRIEIYNHYGLKKQERPELSEDDWIAICGILNIGKKEEGGEDDDEIEPVVSVPRAKKAIQIPPIRTFEPRELKPGERFKPPNRSRRAVERGEFLYSVVPKSVKERVHDDLSIFSQPIN